MAAFLGSLRYSAEVFLLQLPLAIRILRHFSWPFAAPPSARRDPVTPFQLLPLRSSHLLCYPIAQDQRQDELGLSLEWLMSVPMILCPVSPLSSEPRLQADPTTEHRTMPLDRIKIGWKPFCMKTNCT